MVHTKTIISPYPIHVFSKCLYQIPLSPSWTSINPSIVPYTTMTSAYLTVLAGHPINLTTLTYASTSFFSLLHSLFCVEYAPI